MTYANELGAAVTALGDSAALLDVKQTELTTGSLDDSGSVGAGVVAMRRRLSVPASNSKRTEFLARRLILSSFGNKLTRCGGGK